VRGAHFLSHVLWSAWVVWGVNVGLLGANVYWAAQRRAAVARNSGELGA
jgi:membrane-associated PAP2 superfamily phosphatase